MNKYTCLKNMFEKITLDIPSAVGLDIALSMALPSAQPVALPIAPAIAKTIQN
jgi:hypothetical protein